jgi:hypothetical protein
LALLLDESRAPSYDLASRQAEIKDVCSIPEAAGLVLSPLGFKWQLPCGCKALFPVYWHDRCSPPMKHTDLFAIGLLMQAGGVGLVVSLVSKNLDPGVFQQCMLLGNAMLEGGNTAIQDSFYDLFVTSDCDAFFAAIQNHMRQSMGEYRSGSSVSGLEASREPGAVQLTAGPGPGAGASLTGEGAIHAIMRCVGVVWIGLDRQWIRGRWRRMGIASVYVTVILMELRPGVGGGWGRGWCRTERNPLPFISIH